MSTELEAKAYRVLMGDVARHRMIVLRDDGVYRHIRFTRPGSNIWRFDLVTWPGHLVITGDLQDYHFARITDMFAFFRTKQPGEINAQYWAEKLVGHHQKHEYYSFDRFKEQVVQHFLWQRHEIPEGRSRKVWKAIREEILEAEGIDYSKDLAIKAAMDFWLPYGKNRWDGGPGFGFHDVWEWSVDDYDYHFLVSLHAIVWGIHQYDTREHLTELDWERKDHRRTRAELINLRRYHNHA